MKNIQYKMSDMVTPLRHGDWYYDFEGNRYYVAPNGTRISFSDSQSKDVLCSYNKYTVHFTESPGNLIDLKSALTPFARQLSCA